MAETIRRAFVCGHPIAHSRSPIIHGHWLHVHGLNGTYEAIDVAPSQFEAFISTLSEKGFAGGNVTIPHKEAAFRLVQRKDHAAEEIGAVNTLWMEDGILNGTNTDAYGFAANLDDHKPGWDKVDTAIVLGAGGAARAIIHALLERGIGEVRILNRTLARARELADTFGARTSAHDLSGAKELVSDAGLVVNTTALGMDGDSNLPADPEHMPDRALVTDIVYVPLETPFLRAARRRGLATVDGLGMLLHQAVPGFERWFGVRPRATPQLRELVLKSMEDHS
ncbi:MAG: shikimate dehydrogenase [Rhizobiaceae bacterium]|nr:shikimate dehydrogenase [Rhizobiaceae bacterium]